tara:strand:+ start:1444 stop:1632 length:189 start_codon:yes stop_codon:yes gene_type:complete
MRDTNIEFSTEASRDTAYTKILNEAENLGIPAKNVLLEKIDTKLSNFTGKTEEKLVDKNYGD